MRVAVFTEAPADDAFVRELIDHILGVSTESVALSLRTRGWPAVKILLPVVIKGLYYQTAAEGLVVVCDTNGSSLHSIGTFDNACRLCQLLAIANETLGQLKSIEGRAPLRVAVGTAAPAVEAWYEFGVDHAASEAGWLLAHQRDESGVGRKQQLKRAVAKRRGSVSGMNVDGAKADATRVASDLNAFEHAFSRGFGPLAAAVRAWRID